MNTVNNSVEQTKKRINSAGESEEYNHSFSNFNFIAPFYNFLQRLIFGNHLQKAQSFFLNEIKPSSTVLIIGGGSGEIISSIFQVSIPEKVVFVEQSSKMIELAKPKVKNNKVEFVCSDILDWDNDEKFDVIVLPFILDCFSTDMVVQVLQKMKLNLREKGSILFTDFVVKPRKFSFSKFLIFAMYFFFKVTAKLKVSELPDFDLAFQMAGFKLVKKNSFVRGTLEAKVYR